MAKPESVMDPVYLDWNATTPPLREAVDAVHRAALENWGNPASVHRPGQRARAELDRARASIAALVGGHPRDVLLTSGGTEANNLALRSARGPIVLSRLEHPSVVRVAEALEREGAVIGWVEPSSDGRVSPDRVAACIAALGRVALVSLQAVNHETGVVQPLHEVAMIARAAGAQVHCDAVQAVGRLSREHWAAADFVSVAAHKLRGPKGIGALVTRPGALVLPVMRGGDQERGMRPGTQDAALAAGFRIAAAHAIDGPARYSRLGALRDRFEAAVVELGAGVGLRVERNGAASRAPHVTNLSFGSWSGPELCAALDLEGVAISSGSACSAGTAEPSPVIRAIAGEARARGAIRVSLGELTSDADIARALVAFAHVLNVWRGSNPLEGSVPCFAP